MGNFETENEGWKKGNLQIKFHFKESYELMSWWGMFSLEVDLTILEYSGWTEEGTTLHNT